MKKSKITLYIATFGLLVSCVDLVISKYEGTSIAMFCCLVTVWVDALSSYKQNKEA